MNILNINILGLITPLEIIYLTIVVLVIGYIFSGMFRIRSQTTNDITYRLRVNMQDLKLAILVTAPAIVLHELAHKFVAMGFGFPAQFHIWGFGLLLALFLRVINSPLIIIAPGYVGIPLVTDPVAYRLIAAAGPAINLVLWIGAFLILKNAKNLNRKQMIALYLTKKINMILFIFNMIPFGPLDGAKILFGLPS